ncbi:MAG TPA: hypothetical protein VGW30_07775 [Gaiellaceae bacterium]|nr:hypothetical protein [Gaiellaceae bacterium]
MRWLKRLLGSDDDDSTPRDDPRGGMQSDEYRHADPRDVVEEGGTTMAMRRRKVFRRRSGASRIARRTDSL